MALIVGSRLSKLSLAHVVVLVGVFALALTRPLFCQTDLDSAHDIGMPVYGVYDGDSVVSVQLNNGNVHIEIPIWTAAERGPAVGYKFVYNSKAWQNHNPPLGCKVSCQGFVTRDMGSILTMVGPANYSAGYKTETTEKCLGTSGDTYFRWSGFYMQEPDGTKHGFFGFVNSPSYPGCVHPDTTMTAYAEDGSGWMYQYGGTNAGQYTKHGTRIFKTSNGGTALESITDANGNQISASLSGGTWTVTDTLGRTLPNDGSYFDSNGTLQHLAITYTTVQFDLTAFCPGCIPSQQVFSSQLPQTITFPNGMSYTFAYVQNSFGQPSSLTLPSGGIVGLTWSGFDQGGPAIQTRSYTDPSSGQTSTWKYSGRTVTDPLGNDMTVGCFYGGTNMCHVNQLQYFAGAASGGKVVKTVTTDYQTIPADNSPSAAVMPIRVTTAVNVSPGSSQTVVSKVETDYETALSQTGHPFTWGNPSARREYDFGSGAPGPLLRQTTYTYLHDVSTQYRTTNIADRVLTTVICNTAATCDGTGANTVAQTQYVYDSGSLVSTGSCSPATGALGHDYCNFGSGNTLRGNPTQVKRWLNPGGVWLSTLNSFDDLGHVLSTTDPKSNTTSFSYADNFTDGVNHNALAFVTKITYPITAGVSHIQRKQYFFNTGLLAASCGENFPNASACTNTYSPPQSDYATYTYDIMSRPVSVTRGDGGQTTLAYNDVPPLSTTTTSKISATANGVAIAVRDGFGREISSSRSNGESTPFDRVDTCYDLLGRKSFVSYPYQASSTTAAATCPSEAGDGFAYDVLGRITQVTHSDATTVTTSYTGRATKVADEGNGTTPVQRISQVDGLGRLTSVCEVTSATQFGSGGTPAACGQDIAGTGFLTIYGYDALGNLLTVSQGTLGQRTFAYDSLSRLLCAANPETGSAACPNPDNGTYTAGTARYGYDTDGNMTSRTRPAPNQTSGTVTVAATYQYDALNRLTQKSYSDGVTPNAMFSYDQASVTMGTQQFNITNSIGRLSWECTLSPTTCTAAAATMTAFSYDPMGRTAQLWGCQHLNCPLPNLVFSYDYDLLGDELDYFLGTGPHGSTEYVSTYNGAGRLTSHTTPTWVDSTNPANLLTGVQYDAFGHIVSGNLANGLSLSSAYDARGRVTAMAVGTNCSVGNCSTNKYRFTTGYTPNSDIASSTDTVNGNWTYTYDDLNRLSTGVANNGEGCSWDYDRYGNRWHQNTHSGSCTAPQYSFTGNNNRLDGYSYDAVGNLLNDGSHSYQYDAENRVISVNPGATTYIYDAESRRYSKTTGGVAVETTYDRVGNPRLRGNFGPSEIFVAGMHLGTYIVNSAHTDSIFYYDHSDWLGTERARTDLSGIACETIASLPFGDNQTITSACGDLSPLHFTGKERDSESGLDNFGARYDASSMGRFMTPDPLMASAHASNPQTWNRYAYALNNPVRYVDPDGMEVPADCAKNKKCQITVNVNVIWDKQANNGKGLTDQQKKDFMNGQIAPAVEDYANSNIKLNVTYTEGSFTVDADNHTTITGDKKDAVNVVASDKTFDGSNESYNNRAGNSYILLDVNTVHDYAVYPLVVNTTEHELAHHFLGDTVSPQTSFLQYFYREGRADTHVEGQSMNFSQSAFREGLEPRSYAAPTNPGANKPQQ